MSIKTERLAALFPDVYASRQGDSLLHRVLDAVGAELVHADAAVKDLLKSHWIDYAKEGGLDGLGSLLGVYRRLLPDGRSEGDDTFRPLLRSTVPSFIGGGTVEAIKGAVRAALGLPYDLDLLKTQLAGTGGKIGPGLDDLISGLRGLVSIEEFSPKKEVVIGTSQPAAVGTAATLDVNFATVQPVAARIEWNFARGGGRHLSLVRQDSGAGILSKGEFEVTEGETLVLAGEGADFSASIGTTDVTSSFVDVDSTSPPSLPKVPAGSSRWVFSAARSGAFDVSTFDEGQAFDGALFSVRMAWIRYQPLMFDVVVPFFVDAAVKRTLAGTGYENRFRVFKGLSLDAIQKVVDSNRASGVRGMVQYSLSLPGESSEKKPWENHSVGESFSGRIQFRDAEIQDAEESLSAGALDNALETHDALEHFAIGGVFNVSHFDGSFGFQ